MSLIINHSFGRCAMLNQEWIRKTEEFLKEKFGSTPKLVEIR